MPLVDPYDARGADGSFVRIISQDADVDEIFDRIESLSSREDVRIEYLQDTKRFTTRAVSVNVRVESGIDWFDTTVTTSLGDEPLPDADRIFAAVRARQRFVRLDDGTVILLRESLRQSVEDLEGAGIDLDG